VLYQRPLADLTDDQIKRAFTRAAKEYKPFGGSFPAPAELRDYALLGLRSVDDAREILARGQKPPNWEPMGVEEIKRRLAEVAASKTIQ
jgi:hypothetical protein